MTYTNEDVPLHGASILGFDFPTTLSNTPCRMIQKGIIRPNAQTNNGSRLNNPMAVPSTTGKGRSKALTRERLVSEEVFDDSRSEPRQRVLPRAHNPCPIDSSKHALFTKPLDRVCRAFARIVRARLDYIANLLEHIDEHVFLEECQRRLVSPQVEPREKAQIDRLQIEIDLVARKRRDSATWIGGCHRGGLLFLGARCTRRL